MMSADKNIAVFANQCASAECAESCELPECGVCRPCLTAQDITDLHTAYREHMNRGDTKRIFPVPISNENGIDPSTVVDGTDFSDLNAKNQWMSRWFAGKCAMELTWCF